MILFNIVSDVGYPGSLIRNMFILDMPEYPIVKDITGQNNLNLCFVRVKQFVIQNPEPIFQSTKGTLYCNSKGGVP
jgi:hypothetical protein